MNIQPPPSFFQIVKRSTFLEKKCRGGVRGGVETETTMTARGQATDDPAHPGSRRTGTRSGAATRSACVPARWW
jgi:hypothetical protein